MSLSSPSRLFSISNDGIIVKISASRISSYSAKVLCFSPVASITLEKWISWWHFLASMKYVRPWVQVFSNSIRISTSSTLFFSWGSTTSMFYSYFLRRLRKSRKVFLIFSARTLTALDWFGLTLLKMPSAASNMSLLRSSRPIPSGLATELILPRIWMSLVLFYTYSYESITILPLDFSFYSIWVKSFSVSIASVMKRLASASISINSRT